MFACMHPVAAMARLRSFLTHHEAVDDEVVVAEGQEGRGHLALAAVVCDGPCVVLDAQEDSDDGERHEQHDVEEVHRICGAVPS